MVNTLAAMVNAPNPLNATYPISRLSASAPAQSDKPHTMAATHYSFEGNLKASINLNNKGIVPLEVKPTLFNLAGERLEVPPVTIDATTFQVLISRNGPASVDRLFSRAVFNYSIKAKTCCWGRKSR